MKWINCKMLHIELCVVYGGEAVASQHRQPLRAGQSRGSSRWWAVTQWADLVLGPAVSSRASNGPSAITITGEGHQAPRSISSPGWKHLLDSTFTLKTLLGLLRDCENFANALFAALLETQLQTVRFSSDHVEYGRQPAGRVHLHGLLQCHVSGDTPSVFLI